MLNKKFTNRILEIFEIYDKNPVSKISIKDKKFGLTISDSSPKIKPVHSVSVERVSSIDSPIKIEGNISETFDTLKEEKTGLYEIKSPMTGAFYSKPNPNSESFVKKGDFVNESTTVALIEAMKMFNEVKAGVKGVIEEIKFKDGDFVNQGDILFLVKI
ncbi:MAG TPA: biotin/lipoyl-binding protein [Spirochaetota bacterium]|nr:biotin/lipoyl-binding protein [Spirochaetota bacterium]HOM38509.1 biotin/lipoyl-binding protein [Spirochaetota bacterium]HPQ49049.1 biotin/lipoyl-binding protein [Spirochaetota bacterium]